MSCLVPKASRHHEAAEHLRKNSAVVSHDDLVQDGADDTSVHFDLLSSRTEHLKERLNRNDG